MCFLTTEYFCETRQLESFLVLFLFCTVGPSEAEVRESGKNNQNGGGINILTPKSTDERSDSSKSSQDVKTTSGNALLPAVVGAGVGLLLVIIIITVLLTFRMKYQRNAGPAGSLQSDDNTGRLVGSTPHLASVGSMSLQDVGDDRTTDHHIIKGPHSESCTEREMQVSYNLF